MGIIGGGKREFLADKYTPRFLMDLCDGLTGFQTQDVLRPFIGQWMRVRGELEHATPNPSLGTAGVTIVFSDKDQRRDAYLEFRRDLGRLSVTRINEMITAEGQLKSVGSYSLVLENCGLVDPQIASSLNVRAAAEELRKAVEDRVASNEPIRLKPALPKPQSDPAPKVDKRKNASPDEMTRFCKLLLEGWPQTTERAAHSKAVAFFPDNKVPVHPFLDIFRAIRGDKKRGPQPKTRD